MIVWRAASSAIALIALGFASPALAVEDDEMWPVLKEMLFESRPIADGTGVIALDAPYRAYDAGIVPIVIRALIPQDAARYIRTVHLIIDDNPAPVAAVFHFEPEAGDASIETRVRVNEYTNVRAVAETSDGALYMASAYVKAAGGCSAPAAKDHELAMARLGKMKLKPMTPFEPGELNRAQLLISHPNYTGMQIDQLTRNWIPPDYVSSIEVSLDGEPLLTVEGDIAISENPAITFGFVPEEAGTLSVSARDTEGRHFQSDWPIGPSS